MSSSANPNSNSRSRSRSRSPKNSPHSSNSSPRRQPLHERSKSQTNKYGGPTIRIVDQPDAQIYSKNPFPSHPSQILLPRNVPGYTFGDRGFRVSDRNSGTSAVLKPKPIDTLVPRPLQPWKANRHSTSTSISDADTIVNSSPFPSTSSRFSQGTTPRSSPTPYENESAGTLKVLEEGLPREKRPTIRAVIPSDSSAGHALTPRASAASLASSASSDTPTLRKHNHRRGSSTSNPPVPPPKSHKRCPSASSNHKKKKQASSTGKLPVKPILKNSTESFAYSCTSSERPRSSSSPPSSTHAARQVTLENGVRIQFPIVRPPSASGLWVESRVLPKNPARMNNRSTQVVDQWSSQLSTIPSESERGSQSVHGSQSIAEVSGPSGQLPRRQTIASIASSDGVNSSSEPTGSSVSIPLPLFSPALRPPDGRDSDEYHDAVSSLQSPPDGRDSDERHDTVSPLQSPPLKQQRSGYLSRNNSDARPGSSRPGSSQSDFANFIASTIPAWARVYYRRGERTSLVTPESATDESESVRVPTAQSGRTVTPSEGNFPLSIYRPRNRPHQHLSQPVRDSMVISDAPIEQDIYATGPLRNISSPFTPRLGRDKRSTTRLSAWRAPSFNEPYGSLFFSRQNRQILLFCLGFIFPFAWMIAAFLPLPMNPELSKKATPSQADVERAFAQRVGHIDEKCYHKALWWRNLNRIMSAVGILLVGAIIALAVLASRMK